MHASAHLDQLLMKSSYSKAFWGNLMVPSLCKTLFLPWSLYLVNSTHFFCLSPLLLFFSFNLVSLFVLTLHTLLCSRCLSFSACYFSADCVHKMLIIYVSWDSIFCIMLRRHCAPAWLDMSPHVEIVQRSQWKYPVVSQILKHRSRTAWQLSYLRIHHHPIHLLIWVRS